MKLLSDIIKFVLTLFVHEESTDSKLFSAILDCSNNVYFLDGKRKKSLCFYLLDHGIWSDIGSWRDCIDTQLKLKMIESEQRSKKRDKIKKEIANK